MKEMDIVISTLEWYRNEYAGRSAKEFDIAIKAIKELQEYREGWTKVEAEIDKRILEPWENHICDNYFDGLCTAREITKNLRPKEGDINADSN